MVVYVDAPDWSGHVNGTKSKEVSNRDMLNKVEYRQTLSLQYTRLQGRQNYYKGGGKECKSHGPERVWLLFSFPCRSY